MNSRHYNATLLIKKGGNSVPLYTSPSHYVGSNVDEMKRTC